jgi:hypothetical protein
MPSSSHASRMPLAAIRPGLLEIVRYRRTTPNLKSDVFLATGYWTIGSLGRTGVPLCVLGVILREQPLFVVLLWEEEEDDRGAEQDRDDPGSVGGLIARQKRRLRRGSNLAREDSAERCRPRRRTTSEAGARRCL